MILSLKSFSSSSSSSSQCSKEIPEVGIRLSNHMSSKSVISIEEKQTDVNNEIKIMPKLSNWQKITNELKKFITSSVKSEHKRLKLFNFLVIGIMWFSCMITVFNGVKDYLKFDVVSQTRVLEEVPSLFPTVTICSIDAFSSRKSSEVIRNLMLREFNEDLANVSNHSPVDFLSYIEIAHIIALSEVYNPSFGDKNRKTLGFSLDETLEKCVFNKQPCSKEDFEWFYDFHYGNCFKFNSGFNSSGHSIPLKYSNIPGENNGLFLSFFLQRSQNRFSSALSAGLRIFVHNASFTPSSSEGINLRSATLTNIVIKRTIINKAPLPYSECIDLKSFNSTLYQSIMKAKKAYRQSDCFDLCFQKSVIENCGCYYLQYPKLMDPAPCLTTDELLCASNQRIRFIETNLNKQCSTECPLECESNTFDLYLSSSDYPTENLFEIQKNNKDFTKKYFNNTKITYDRVRRSSIATNIYYPHLKYTALTELEKITIIDLLAGIGGTFGLFLGISLIHLIKLFNRFILFLKPN